MRYSHLPARLPIDKLYHFRPNLSSLVSTEVAVRSLSRRGRRGPSACTPSSPQPRIGPTFFFCWSRNFPIARLRLPPKPNAATGFFCFRSGGVAPVPPPETGNAARSGGVPPRVGDGHFAATANWLSHRLSAAHAPKLGALHRFSVS